MIRSMTGYGRGENFQENRKFVVEIKSVNHRYNDLTIKMPRSMNNLEDTVRKTLKDNIWRGKIDVYINFETHSDEDIRIKLNKTLVDAYVNIFSEIEDDYDIQSKDKLALLTKIPDVIQVEKSFDEDDIILNLLMPALLDAITAFNSMREAEGETLKQDIFKKLENMELLVLKVKDRYPQVIEAYRERLSQKVAELLLNEDIDENRILTEVTIFADKADVDEEITRLNSHINQAKGFLRSHEPIGRKLDFIVQEMNREVNTITSKSTDLDITNTCIDLKAEIEKIREQAQNIE